MFSHRALIRSVFSWIKGFRMGLILRKSGPVQARQRGTGICHAAQARARRSYQTVNESGSPHLPGLRETVLDAEATSEDRSSTDAAGVPAALGTASIVPDGCTFLCKKTIDPGEENWAGKEEYRGAKEGRKEDDRMAVIGLPY